MNKLTKTLAILCAFVMVTISVAGCMPATDVVSEQNSDAQSSDSSEVNAVFNSELPADRKYINVINGASYTFNITPSDKYPDSGNKLTDGIESELENDDTWVGILGKKDIEIVFDLGETKNDLCGFAINTMFDSSVGRGIPKSVEMYASDDGTKFVRVASSSIYSSTFASKRIIEHSAYTAKGFSARYVKLVITDIITSWTFIDNFRLFTAVEAGKVEKVDTMYYVNQPMPENVKASFWDSSEAGYAKRVNMLRGRSMRVYTVAPLSEELMSNYYNTPASSTLLTDGKTGSESYSDKAYFHMTKGFGRYFIFDLEHLSALDSATVGIYSLNDYAIVHPESIAVLLSEDGKSWQTVVIKTTSEFPSAEADRATVTLDFEKTYKARFVKFEITISAHCWIDELEVFGTKKISSDTATIKADIIGETNYSYPSLDVLGGSENIYLAYNYKVENRASGLRSKEQYKPLVGYYNTDGVLKDYFFDSFLYLPCSTVCPSGGKLWADSEAPSFKSDWMDYMDDLYKDGYNLKALNEATGEVKTELDDPDYKAKVYLSIFNSTDSCTNFGDVDGDGINENMSKLKDRKKVARWWIDMNIRQFEENNFENLKLHGFYWYDEALKLSDEKEKAMIEFIIDYVHSMGYYIIWIPYYQAAGFSSWKTVGFDLANMQPNYTFNENMTEAVLYDNATLTKMLGMGVEIEIDGKSFSSLEYYKRYMAYLRVGVETGYMNTVKMYYADAVPGVYLNSFYSSISRERSIYDITYLYAKRKLGVRDINIIKTEFNVTAGKKQQGTFEIDNDVIVDAYVKYSPLYGRLAVDASGNYRYTPLKNFKGTDEITITFSNGVTTSDVSVKFVVD